MFACVSKDHRVNLFTMIRPKGITAYSNPDHVATCHMPPNINHALYTVHVCIRNF